MRGLHKATGYWNTVQARLDWAALVEKAKAQGMTDADIVVYAPPEGAGHKRIDTCIARLREAMRNGGGK